MRGSLIIGLKCRVVLSQVHYKGALGSDRYRIYDMNVKLVDRRAGRMRVRPMVTMNGSGTNKRQLAGGGRAARYRIP
jgi:hypothetical protein